MFIAQLFVSGIVPRGYNLMVQCNPEQTPGSECVCVCVCVCVVCVVCVVVVGGGGGVLFLVKKSSPGGFKD